jgi:hypothetical protein
MAVRFVSVDVHNEIEAQSGLRIKAEYTPYLGYYSTYYRLHQSPFWYTGNIQPYFSF